MAILVDEATWPFRGDRWAHLVSDESFDELHRFAQRLGLRRLSFQGDHYDVPSALRIDAIRNGAISVTGRELVRRLRAAGLRRPGSGHPWTRVLEIGAGTRLDDAARTRIDDVLAAYVGADRRRSVGEALAGAAPFDPRLVGWGAWCLARSGELAIAADVHPEDALPPAEIDAMLTQSGVFDAVYCWSRDDATTIEMMMRLR
ncbi:MAG: DUF4031 domain-containing protein [Acidimicrobiales bacterium]